MQMLVAANFVTKWCEIHNIQEWYPTGANILWQLQAPLCCQDESEKVAQNLLLNTLCSIQQRWYHM